MNKNKVEYFFNQIYCKDSVLIIMNNSQTCSQFNHELVNKHV